MNKSDPSSCRSTTAQVHEQSDEQSQHAEGNGQKGNRKRSDEVFDGVSGFRASEPTQNTRTTKTQVTNVALQTDSCDTLYVT